MTDDTEDIALNFGEENEISARKNLRWVIESYQLAPSVILALAKHNYRASRCEAGPLFTETTSPRCHSDAKAESCVEVWQSDFCLLKLQVQKSDHEIL